MEKILDEKPRGRGRKMHLLIKWKGYLASDNSWEPAADVHVPELVAEFRSRGKKTNKDKA